ncbi:type II secretion system F family protein [Candidatus Micrarchaeota archaeon]|nr:type II secretion system F family protein [Candidatus Micrarchaeota archaeon]
MIALEFLPFLAVLLVLTARALWSWRRASRIRKLEADLPAALFSMAAYEPGVPLETILSDVAACSPEPLRSAFATCVRQVRSGVPFPKALQRMRLQSGSRLLDRVVQLLQAAYRSGVDLSDVFRKVAEEAYHLQRLQAQRREAFALQKYTLYAGVLLVPALLGLLSARTDAASSAYGTSVFWGLQFYLASFGVLSAAFIATVQSDRSALPSRAASLALCGLLVFHTVRSWGA